jgi:hypothetical protein
MAAKRHSKVLPTKSKSVAAERRVLRAKPLRVDLRAEPVPRPAIAPGLYRRPEIAKRLTQPEIKAVISKAGMKPLGGRGGSFETHVDLSPAVPWVDGRGWLEAAGMLQAWFPTTTISFIPDEPSKEQGILYIWLDGLTSGDAYVAEIRVGGYSVNPQVPGTYNIGASDAAHADVHHTGASQNLTVFIPAVSGTLSLIVIETKGLGGWLFDDAHVTHLGTLG